jgi:hypothetical protein
MLSTVLGCVVLVGTALLAWSGIHDVYHFDHGAIVPRFAQPVTTTSLYAGTTTLHVLALLVGTRFATRYRKALDAAEMQTVLTSWRLTKLLPRELLHATPAARDASA